jgi:hypothetical protein
MPVDPADPVVTAACVFCCRRAMGEAITRHSLRPPDFEGETRAKLGQILPRGRFALKMRCGRATLHESVWRFYYDPAMIKKTAGPVW